ncbi:hypothetical protein Ddc_12016 [Ditylenchus destructor]|nr:hypothetical protein Ddc_12016 [Ditylenchus destructor]
MSSLPNEIFSDITNFLPNDDITDQMLMSRTFNALVTPRLQKIDQEMATMNQSIEYEEIIAPNPIDDVCCCFRCLAALNLKRFEPIGSEAKKRMKEVFENQTEFLYLLSIATLDTGMLDGIKTGMSLERFDDETFLRILSVLVSVPKFCEEHKIKEPEEGSTENR